MTASTHTAHYVEVLHLHTVHYCATQVTQISQAMLTDPGDDILSKRFPKSDS